MDRCPPRFASSFAKLLWCDAAAEDDDAADEPPPVPEPADDDDDDAAMVRDSARDSRGDGGGGGRPVEAETAWAAKSATDVLVRSARLARRAGLKAEDPVPTMPPPPLPEGEEEEEEGERTAPPLKRLSFPPVCTARPRLRPRVRRLALTFPDGAEEEAEVRAAEVWVAPGVALGDGGSAVPTAVWAATPGCCFGPRDDGAAGENAVKAAAAGAGQ